MLPSNPASESSAPESASKPEDRVPEDKLPEDKLPEDRVPEDKLKVNVFQRSFAVLEYVVRAGVPVAPSDIADHLQLPKPTVYRMIESFEAQGFLRRHFASRRIGIGPRLADFGFDVVRASVQYAPRRSILNALVAEVGETCNIGTLEGNEIVYLDRVEAKHWPLRLNFHIGSRVPLYCTAIGKLFLAYLPAHQRNRLLSAMDMQPLTAHTITERAVLEAELDVIAHDGLSIDREEYTIGVICVAAPIFNKKGEIQAGVAIQAPLARMSVVDAQNHKACLQETAKQIGASFMLK